MLKVSETIEDELLKRYAALIYKQTGIIISPQKKMLLSNRLRRRLKATECASFGAYYEKLSRLSPHDPEWAAFLQEVTTHETYLFRDTSNWDWFREEYLKQIADEARKGLRKKQLRIWSAACSTGDEAFTIASCIADRLSPIEQWKIDIVGTDIGYKSVATATEATFDDRAMRQVSASYRNRFFVKIEGNSWQAKSVLRNMCRFQVHNLMTSLSETPFDLVVLKNVLIYFDRTSKTQVVNNIARVIRPGGYLITGPAEGVGALLGGYQREKPWLHHRDEQAGNTLSK